MTNRTISGRSKGSLFLSAVLLLSFFASTTQGEAQAAAAAAQAAPLMLHIDILEGEGALNNIRQRDAREPVVQVTDENHKPVSGVAVVFLIHSGPNGASASFGGASSLTATTGADGIAHAPGLTVAQTPGSFTIGVTATAGAVTATTTITQSIVLSAIGTAAGGSAATSAVVHGTIFGLSKIAVIAIVGSAVTAGVVAGVVVATKSNSGTSLTLGTGSVTQ